MPTMSDYIIINNKRRNGFKQKRVHISSKDRSHNQDHYVGSLHSVYACVYVSDTARKKRHRWRWVAKGLTSSSSQWEGLAASLVGGIKPTAQNQLFTICTRRGEGSQYEVLVRGKGYRV